MRDRLVEYVEDVELVQPKSCQEMKDIIHEELVRKKRKVIANFQLQPVYPDYPDYPNLYANYGHFSPIIYASDNEVCIGDVWKKVADY